MNRALILARKNAVSEAVQILGDLALHPSSTLTTEMMAKMALAQILGVPLPDEN